MNVLVLNSGSSSIKYQLFKNKDEKFNVLSKGILERIGLADAIISHQTNGKTVHKLISVMDHNEGIEIILDYLTNPKYGSIRQIEDINVVGHRVVHGGEIFNEGCLVTDDVIKKIESLEDLAPLHNPSNLKGIKAMHKKLPHIPQTVVFDTSFHQNLPPKAYMYGLPYEYYEKYKIRKYGFHGMSHKYVANKAADILHWNINNKKIISCHLGNGASVCAIENGKSIETSMGFTPNSGLLMGTRTGNVDLGALLYITHKKGYSVNELNKLINSESGLKGITGISSDMREIEVAADEGIARAKLAIDMFSYNVKKTIGAHMAVLGGVDLLIFTGGIGENDPFIRSKICRKFEFIGLKIDEDKNHSKCKNVIISTDDSTIKAMVIKTNEELVIANETMKILEKKLQTV